MKLPIYLYGHPILREIAKPVTGDFSQLRDLVQDMTETMDAAIGVGLAAPQIGKSIRLFIRRDVIEDDEGGGEMGDVKVYINPKVEILTQKTELCDEGCLSIPKVRGEVARPLHIRVEAHDLDGKHFAEELMGYNARCVQHENDHLNGILYIDRLIKSDKLRLEQHLKAIKRQAKETQFLRVV